MVAMEKTFGTGTRKFTPGTVFASIVRFNLDNFNPIQPGLVFNESLQLIEAPGVPVKESVPKVFSIAIIVVFP